MRGTLLMFAAILITLLGGGLYLFTSTAEPPDPPLYDCDLGQVRLSATWEPATGSLAGAIIAENESVKPCRIEGVPEITLQLENGEALPASPFRFRMEASLLAVNKGERAMAGFVWRNWCGNEIESPVYASVKLPNYDASFSIPILDPDGTVTTRSPRCDVPNEGSELAVGPFVKEGEPLYSDGEE